MTDSSVFQSWGKDHSGLSPLKAIKAHCPECSGGGAHEVKICHISRCPLHPYRMGKNTVRPTIKLSDEERAARSARAKAAFSKNRQILPETRSGE